MAIVSTASQLRQGGVPSSGFNGLNPSVSSLGVNANTTPVINSAKPVGQVGGISALPANQFSPQPTNSAQFPISAQPQAAQQYGLSGAEAALQQGLQGGSAALQTGQGQALNTLQQGQNFAQGQLAQGGNILRQGALGGLAQLQGGTAGAMRQLQQGQAALSGGFGGSASTVDPMTGQPLFQQAAQGVGAYSPAGLQAQGVQSALSGAQGQAAFDQALIDSPVQKFLREQGERAVINQASATGGLGGGEVLRELTEYGQGLAGTQLQQQIQNLNALSGQGLQAAGQQGQFLSQAGQQQGNLAAQNASLQTQGWCRDSTRAIGPAST